MQAIKAITGGVIALNGQLIKVKGHLVAAKGKLLETKGDAITEFGKHLATKALLTPMHVSNYDHKGTYYLRLYIVFIILNVLINVYSTNKFFNQNIIFRGRWMLVPYSVVWCPY